MTIQDPRLPYDRGALAPHVSRETLDYHLGKHHLGYVRKLNKLVEGGPLRDTPLHKLLQTRSGPIFQNAAQVWNHDFYWHSMSPNGGGEPKGRLRERLDADFGGRGRFEQHFLDLAMQHFGSGWVWLVKKEATLDAPLAVITSHDAGNPITHGMVPLLCTDLWEHAYYIDYRNDRGKYLDGFFQVVDWAFGEANLLLSEAVVPSPSYRDQPEEAVR